MSAIEKVSELNIFAAELGWGNVRAALVEEPAPGGQVLRYYYTEPAEDVLFQINERPDWQVAVYALRYKICTGWHRFDCSSVNVVLNEAKRLSPVLSAKCFLTAPGRRCFRAQYPGLCGWTWERIRKEGPPVIANLL